MTRNQILHIKLMHLSMLSWRAGEGGRQGIGWGFGDLTIFKNLLSNSLPSFQSIATKFPHPGMHIAVYPKAGPKKGTIKISPNKTLQSFFINVTASPKIHVPVKAAIIRFNHSIRVLIHSIEYRNLKEKGHIL